MASEATLLKAAINTGIAAFGKDGGRKANNEFGKLIKALTGHGGTPERPTQNMADLVKKGRRGHGQ